MKAQYLNSSPFVSVTGGNQRRGTKHTARTSLSPFLVEVDEFRDRVNVGPVRGSAFLFCFVENGSGEIVPAELGNERVPDRQVSFVQATAVGVAPVQNLFVGPVLEDALAQDAIINAEEIRAGGV